MTRHAARCEADLTPNQAATLKAARDLHEQEIEPILAKVEAITGCNAQKPRQVCVALGLWPVEVGAKGARSDKGPKPGTKYKDHARRVRWAPDNGDPSRLELIKRIWAGMHRET